MDFDEPVETRSTMKCPKCRSLPPVETKEGQVVDGAVAGDQPPAASPIVVSPESPRAGEDGHGSVAGNVAPPAASPEATTEAPAASPEAVAGAPAASSEAVAEAPAASVAVEESQADLAGAAKKKVSFAADSDVVPPNPSMGPCQTLGGIVLEVHGGIRNFASEASIFCSKCGFACTICQVRLTSKMKNTWQCKKCDVKIVQLHRGFGSWPAPGFELMTDEAQQKFYSDVRDLSGPSAITKAQYTLEEYEEHERSYEMGGKFLPLSVWAAKGYDVAAIEEKSLPANIQVHPILGKCYRVEILKLAESGRHGTKRTQAQVARGKKAKLAKLLDLANPQSASAAAGVGAANAATAEAKADADAEAQAS